MKDYNRVYAKVNLDTIEHNLTELHRNTAGNTRMMAVIKADGYGHGAIPIAKRLETLPFLWGFAVATPDEAIVLRRQGIQKPIFILGCTFPDQIEDAVKEEIHMTVYREDMARIISDAAVQQGKKAFVHIKIDTGMSRIGFPVHPDSLAMIKRISQLPGLEMTGFYTHFAKADETDKAFTKKQLRDYKWMAEQLYQSGVMFQFRHTANSAGIIELQGNDMEVVRAGIAMYGLYPSDEVNKDEVKLRPALELYSRVIHVKEVEANTSVGYGGTFVSAKAMKIATIPVGYADGYPRSLSGRGYVLIRGQKAPVIGRICMDQFMVDVTEIPDTQFGDQVTLIGCDGDEVVTVEELGELSGRFRYEFVCDLGKRIPRVYVQGDQVVEQIDYF